ncbi:MAG: hypothetical protein HAW60_04955 [Bdellovibrionales bacterium]|nr:hypothetical protein [Bdellovibrionales bacterium]
MKITPIIMNYNLPDITDDIYNILKSSGFEDILSVDNGSDINPLAKSANFILPKNIKSSGQIRMSLTYLMDYFPADYYLLINNSGNLFSNINYKKIIEKDIEHLKAQFLKKKFFKKKLGVLLASMLDKPNIPRKHLRQFVDKSQEYRSIFCPTTLCMAVSHDLLTICRKNNSSFFNLSLKRGWGNDLELFYEANKNNYINIVSSNFYTEWLINRGYKLNLGGEPVDDYHKYAMEEMQTSFNKKYSVFWNKRFRYQFLKNTLFLNLFLPFILNQFIL